MVEGERLASTRPLVDSDAEHRLLEELLEAAKPPLPPGREAARLHHLLATPFRYPPLRHGSRFGRRHERGLWYGAEAVRTALAETGYYRLLLFTGTAARLVPHQHPFTAFQASVRTRACADLLSPPFARHLARVCSPSDYSASQPLGAEMRADGIEVVRYRSARDPGRGACVALFTPAAFARPGPLAAPQGWLCTVTAALDVEFRREGLRGVETVAFALRDFLVEGRLPAPGA